MKGNNSNNSYRKNNSKTAATAGRRLQNSHKRLCGRRML